MDRFIDEIGEGKREGQRGGGGREGVFEEGPFWGLYDQDRGFNSSTDF
jgi:hypothetical protein